MPELTRIQMVLALQAVDLFAHCSAEQMVRIAGIARQRRLCAEQPVYARNDPADALYCVVEGSVALYGDHGGVRRRGAGQTFGAEEILSDRLRAEEARAEHEAVVLAIEADDFFDLLSHNIEIVKALFRQLLRPAGESAAAGLEAPLS